MRKYIYQHPAWPHFTWDNARMVEPLAEIRLQQGRILGRLDALGFVVRKETAVAALTEEIVRSSEIEGELLNALQVRSSVARKLGVGEAGLVRSSRYIDGIVGLMMDAIANHNQALTEERLFSWHEALFATGMRSFSLVNVGGYRNDEMQIVSGAIGREKIHYEAPPPQRVEAEMRQLLQWINSDEPIDAVLKAGIAHFWFIIIHPFDDGNGRLARAITEMLLARSDQYIDRYFSLSARLLIERKDYYAALNAAQYSSKDISSWLLWYLGCLNRALLDSSAKLDTVVAKADFWARNSSTVLNERQRRMINALFDGFAGKLTTMKWAKICKTSHDTALRDIKDLIEKRILEVESGGSRSTSYRLL